MRFGPCAFDDDATLTDRLTIVLTLKDRSAFTERWMRYMDACACPYRILVADGGEDQTVERALRDPSRYPRLRYDYLRYPVDADVTHYYTKLADVVDRVTTPYVLLADNDDFFLLDAMGGLCDAITEDPGAVSCGGRRLVLRLFSPRGELLASPRGASYQARVDLRPKAIVADSPAARLSYFLHHVQRHYLWSSWYCVHRTAALAGALGIARRHVFRDPVAHELHVHLALLCQGNSLQRDVWSLVSQTGASQLTSQLEASGNIIERFVVSNAFDDLRHTLDELSMWLPSGGRGEVTAAIAAWIAACAARAYPPPPTPSVTRAWWFRRPTTPASVRLPALEPFILDSAL